MIIERKSVVDAQAHRVWARVVTPEGIDDEMRPLMTMSIPRRLGSVTIDFGCDALTIAELEPGQRFHERSTMPSMRRWEYGRAVTPVGDRHRRLARHFES